MEVMVQQIILEPMDQQVKTKLYYYGSEKIKL